MVLPAPLPAGAAARAAVWTAPWLAISERPTRSGEYGFAVRAPGSSRGVTSPALATTIRLPFATSRQVVPTRALSRSRSAGGGRDPVDDAEAGAAGGARRPGGRARVH